MEMRGLEPLTRYLRISNRALRRGAHAAAGELLGAYLTFEIFTTLPLARGSFGSLTTVTYRTFSPSPNATFVVPSPASIANTWSSLPSGDNFSIFPPNH